MSSAELVDAPAVDAQALCDLGSADEIVDIDPAAHDVNVVTLCDNYG